MNSVELQELLSAPTFENMANLWCNSTEVIEEIHKYEKSFLKGDLCPTASVWASFLQMVQILLDFTRSGKQGDWKLHMQATEKMLPWMFAYDRPNYARYLTYYWVKIQKLPETSRHPRRIYGGKFFGSQTDWQVQ